MKLRVILIDSNGPLDGLYQLQVRRWGFWRDLYWNIDTSSVIKEMVLGKANIRPAVFNDFLDAQKYGLMYRQSAKAQKRKRGVWYI